jgi:hypothetical protein
LKIFFDTEFIERGPQYPITLLSIGIVREDGQEYYAVNANADHDTANDWVKANVLPNLGDSPPKSRMLIAREIAEMAGAEPEFWAYYCAYDWVVLCQLFGTMMDLPKGWPMYCNDLKIETKLYGNPRLPPQETTEHNALADARWVKSSYYWLREVHKPKLPPNLVR